MAALDGIRRRLASWIAPARGARMSKRAYAGAMINRLTSDWIAQSTSHDAELKSSLRVLRNRTRELVRDNDYAKHAITVIKNNIVGSGVGMQAQVPLQRGEGLNDKLNTQIETAWQRWCRRQTCDVAGRLSFKSMQRVVTGALPESGEILVRKVRQRFGGGRIPFALELIESDRLVDYYTLWRAPDTGNAVRMGVEVDAWQRPVAYWLYPYHPGDMELTGGPIPISRLIRVAADEILHLYVPTRPGATRAAPWFHTAMVRLNHLRGYEEAEIIAARASACIMGFIKSPEPDNPSANDAASGSGVGDDVVDGERVTDMAPAQIRELADGEDFIGFNPTRPNTGADPFMKMQLRAVAVGVDMSYESLTGDYSQSNFSSSRMGWVAERDHWRVLQDWLIESFHQEVYEAWLEMAVLAGEVDAPAYETAPELYADVKWMPRGWAYIDPLKDVQADRMAVRAGFKLQSDVLAQGGTDMESWSKGRRRELDEIAQQNLVVESDPAQVDLKGQVQKGDPIDEEVGAPAEDANPADNGEASKKTRAALRPVA